MRITGLSTAILGVALALGCSKSKDDDGDKATGDEGAAAGDEDTAAVEVEPANEIETRVHTNHRGEKRVWTNRGGIEVLSEDYKRMYESRGSIYAAVKTDIQVGDEGCVIDYKIDARDAGGKQLATFQGIYPAKAGEKITITEVEGFSPDRFDNIDKLESEYFTRCGDELDEYPHELQVSIDSVEEHQQEMGVFDLRFAKLELTPEFAPERCHFDLKGVEVDEDGWALSVGFANYSLPKGRKGTPMLRHGSSERGQREDFGDLVAGQKVWIQSLECPEKFDPAKAEIEGLEITDISLAPYAGEKNSADHFAMDAFKLSAKVKSTYDEDCAFSVFFHALDDNGYPMRRVPHGATMHVAAGATGTYEERGHGTWMWKDAAGDFDRMVVNEVRPNGDCTYFKPDKAIQ